MTQRGLPLLQRELLEQSARKRTYAWRVIFAGVVFVTAFSWFWDYVRYSEFGGLGRGDDIFELVLGFAFGAIYVYLPAVCCGVISSEKERQTLPLLFLTRLSPWAIILEKLSSRLVPFLFLLLTLLPIMTLCFALGGLELSFVVECVYILLVAALQIGSIAVFASAFCRTTTAAFFSTYLIGLSMFFGPLFIAYCLHVVIDVEPDLRMFGFRYLWFAGLSPPYLLDAAYRTGFGTVFLFSIPMLASTVCFLVLAHKVLIPRAEASAANLPRRALQVVDRLTNRLSGRLLGRKIVRSELPHNEPVAWREQTKTLFGCRRYQIMFALFCAAIILGIFSFMAFFGPVMFGERFSAWDFREANSVVYCGVWIVSTVIVIVKASSLFSQERSRQTLDALLTTPQSNRALLSQKMQSVTSLIWCMIAVIMLQMAVSYVSAVANFSGSMRRSGYHAYLNYEYFWFPVFCVVTSLIYLPMIAWLSVLIGLRVRSQMKAVLTALSVVIAWCIVPVFLVVLSFELLDINSRSGLGMFLVASPMMAVLFSEIGEMHEVGGPASFFVVNTGIYWFISSRLKKYCHRRMGHWLGRDDAESIASR
jgi:ABC-type transport system involved in multi-copper enzyme maturation permease subunit